MRRGCGWDCVLLLVAALWPAEAAYSCEDGLVTRPHANKPQLSDAKAANW